MSERVARVRRLLAELEAEAILISHPANRHYVSGFPDEDHAPDETAGILLISASEAKLFVSPTNLPWATASANPGIEVVGWERPWQTTLGKHLREQGYRRVAFEDRALIVADYTGIRDAAEDVEFISAGAAVHKLREVKDASEIARIRRAAEITDAALQRVLSQLEPGVTEKALVWMLESAMRDFGADGPAFGTGVGAGPHGARPHHSATDRPIAAGEPVVIDMGAKVDGYCADLTRTVVLGDPTPLFRERYNLVLAAQLAALGAVRPGVSGRDADAAARDVIAAAGHGDAFFHGLGHGVGLLIHEAPSLGQQSEDTLLPGQIVTVEPGVYFDGWGGIRIEDLAVVTESGIEILSNSPK
ncbi:MAG: aminopeptidase P family protein [Thermomicrobiales bacterium]|nr:aminopeptidase P family protein [Thermomicrobiales bacterium]